MAQQYTADDSSPFGALGETTGGVQGNHESEHKSQRSHMATTTVCSIKSTKKRKAICLRIQSKMNGAARGGALPARVMDSHLPWMDPGRAQACSPPGLLSAVVASDGNCGRL